MELTFTELDNEPLSLVENQPQNQTQNPYKKPKVSSYDDILTSLNLKVNNGKLEYIQSKQPKSHYDQFKTCYKKQLHQKPQPSVKQIYMQPNQYQGNYIYNKYFKDYKDPLQTQDQDQEPIYVTPQEYKRRVILEVLRRREEQKKIAKIKSKKLLFAQDKNIPAPIINASPNNLNKLFRFSR
jgi:hypothetical protein